MKSLVIGAAGFVGKHLIDHLRDGCNWFISASKLPHERLEATDVEIHDLDVLDAGAVESLLRETKPDCVFHLAAQSSVALSWREPQVTVDINIKGAINVLDGVRMLDYRPRLLLVGSSEEYGHISPWEIPVRETIAVRPGNIYAVTKVCQNMIGKIYADAYGMDVMMVRAFNNIGPGQSPAFVVSGFCKQVAEIEAGLREPVMMIGNLSPKRDFIDVRDVVRAYGLLIEKGKPSETYNVGSGRSVSVDSILKQILALSPAVINVVLDPSRFRPDDIPVIEADIIKLRSCTAWTPQFGLEETLAETLEFWRKNVGSAGKNENA